MATENPNEQKPSANADKSSGSSAETTSNAAQPTDKSDASKVDEATWFLGSGGTACTRAEDGATACACAHTQG